MAWAEITESHVQTRLAGAELNALKTVALANGQANPLTEIIADAVNETRGYCAARYTLGPDGTVPGKLVSATLAIIRYRFITRLPLKTLLTEERKAEYRDALTLLRDVAAGRFAIEEPETASTEVIAGSAGYVNTRTLTRTRADQDGL